MTSISEECVRANMVRMGFEPDEIEEAVLDFSEDQTSQEQPVRGDYEPAHA